MLSRKWYPIVLALILVTSLLACGPFGGATASPTATPASAEQAAATATLAAASGGEPTATKAAAAVAEATETPAVSEEPEATEEPTAETVAESEELVLPELQGSLEGVDTYSVVMTIAMQGTTDITMGMSSFTITEEADKAAEAYHLVMDGVGEDDEPFKMEVVTIGDDSWISFGDSWMHTKADESSSSTAMADSFMAQGDQWMDAAQEQPQHIGVEEVNGVTTDHYRWDKSEFAEMGTTLIGSGDVWIAQENDLMMKMIFHAEGEITGTEGEEGVMDMTWEVMSINQPVNIAPPEEFSAENALPVMEGAEDSDSFMSTPDMVLYDIEATIEDVVAFYDTALADLGWTKGEVSSMEGFASVTYTQGSDTLSLLVTTSDDSPGVASIMLTRQTASE